MNEKKYTNKIYYNSNLQSKTKLPYNEKFQYLNDKDKNLNETTYTQAINNAQNHRTILFNNNSQNCLEETTNRIHNNNHLQSEITNLITTNVNSTLPHNRFKSVYKGYDEMVNQYRTSLNTETNMEYQNGQQNRNNNKDNKYFNIRHQSSIIYLNEHNRLENYKEKSNDLRLTNFEILLVNYILENKEKIIELTVQLESLENVMKQKAEMESKQTTFDKKITNVSIYTA